ncbi:MAG: DUF962 domain-containing protein [Legionellaceae bacterium]|nr:DUF962 domain-containing protein [Legionellaceae bacterium]
MHSFIEQARIYARYHTKTVTRYTHFLGVPLLLFSLMLLFSFVHLMIPGYLDRSIAEVLVFLLFLYYLRLNWRLALSIAPVLLLLLWLALWLGAGIPTSFSLQVFAYSFIAGLLLQLAGHLWEGQGPAFISHFRQLLIAPLYLTAEVYFHFGKMQNLEQDIRQEEDSIR